MERLIKGLILLTLLAIAAVVVCGYVSYIHQPKPGTWEEAVKDITPAENQFLVDGGWAFNVVAAPAPEPGVIATCDWENHVILLYECRCSQAYLDQTVHHEIGHAMDMAAGLVTYMSYGEDPEPEETRATDYAKSVTDPPAGCAVPVIHAQSVSVSATIVNYNPDPILVTSEEGVTYQP